MEGVNYKVYRTCGEFLESIANVETIDERLVKLNAAVQHGQFLSATVVAEIYEKLNKYTEEFISVPIEDIFESSEFLDELEDDGIFYEYAEHLHEAPMVKLRYQGNDTRVIIDDLHGNKSPKEQRIIARYAIKWKMKMARKASEISEAELKDPLTLTELLELKKILQDLRTLGIKCPRGEIEQKEPVSIQGFSDYTNKRIDEREIDITAAQVWVDSSILMFKQDGARRLYIAFDGSVAVEVENGMVSTIYPSTSFGDGSRRLMQKALSLMKQRK